MIDPPDADASGEPDLPDEEELEEVVRRLVGGSDSSTHPMHHPILPPAPALVPADEIERLAFWLSPATDGDLGTVAFWQTVTAFATGRLARLTAFEAGVEEAGGIVPARMGMSARDAAELAPAGAGVAESPTGVRLVTDLIGCLPLAGVAALAKERLGPASGP